jgi:hypothetical protein
MTSAPQQPQDETVCAAFPHDKAAVLTSAIKMTFINENPLYYLSNFLHGALCKATFLPWPLHLD